MVYPVSAKMICGEAQAELAKMPKESVQCIVTSPPYWQLGEYSVDGQLGAERDITPYIERTVEIFREARRVLHRTGTMWLNLGDTYSTNARSGQHNGMDGQVKPWMKTAYRHKPAELKLCNLIGMPWRIALALQADGWYLRCDVIWSKKSGRPGTVTARPHRTHEYLFMFSRRSGSSLAPYYYNMEAMEVPTVSEDARWATRPINSVWEISTTVSPKWGRYAPPFPEELAARCIRAGAVDSPTGLPVLDFFAGTGTTLVAAQKLRVPSIGIEIRPEVCKVAQRRASLTFVQPPPSPQSIANRAAHEARAASGW